MAETSWYDACEEMDESFKITENDIIWQNKSWKLKRKSMKKVHSHSGQLSFNNISPKGGNYFKNISPKGGIILRTFSQAMVIFFTNNLPKREKILRTFPPRGELF